MLPHPMQTLIEAPGPLDEALAVLQQAPQIALDIEGDGLFRYRARLCTVQLASADRIAVVDTLAVDPQRLASIAGPEGPLKVVHDASFDVRMLREAGVPFAKLFDTSVAARFLGEPATGLASLVSKFLEVTLEKEQQQADWGKRPLTPLALRYLENDVRYLLPLAERLREAVREADIELEVLEESRWVVTNAEGEEPEARPPWTRIKGSADLEPLAQAVLREVALVREQAAQESDVPPFKIVANRSLLELAGARPTSVGEAARIRGLDRGRARRLLRDLVEGVRRGEAVGAPPAQELERLRSTPLPPDERARRQRNKTSLTQWRREEAEARGVDPQVVLPGHCLTDVAALGPRSNEELARVAGLGEFRIERYGEAVIRRVAAS